MKTPRKRRKRMKRPGMMPGRGSWQPMVGSAGTHGKQSPEFATGLKHQKTEYATKHCKRSHLGGDSPVLCKFSDGSYAELHDVTQSEKWPED